MLVVISYDIPDNRRRNKVSKFLLDHGGERVQRSVFECHLTSKQYAAMLTQLRKLIQADEDSFCLYRLCESCRGRAAYLGAARPVTEPGLRII